MSVSVYRRGSGLFVVTQHGSFGGDPCIVAGPLEELSIEASPAGIGEAIFRGLKRTTHNYPDPENEQEWKQVTAPLLAAAKCKSWSAFAKAASSLRVDMTGSKVVVQPSQREKSGAFAPVVDRRRAMEAPTAEELGSLVAADLQFAATRDDA